jgi:hypothetical protein
MKDLPSLLVQRLRFQNFCQQHGKLRKVVGKEVQNSLDQPSHEQSHVGLDIP